MKRLFILSLLLTGCIGNDSVDVETGPLELYIVPPPIYAPNPVPLLHPNPAKRKSA